MAIGNIIGSLLGLGQGILGTGSRQTEMSQARTEMRPEDLQAILNQRTSVQGSTADLLQQLQRSQQAIQQGYQLPSSQFQLSSMPTTGFQFGQSPDAMTMGLAALGTQAIGQQTGAQQRQIAQQFRGQPGASRVLQAQAGMQSRLQQNPLLFQALQQQQGRELAQAQQQMAQIQAQNQAELLQAQQRQAQTEALNRALLGREQALTGLSTAGLGAQQNLFDLLSQLGQGLGTRVSTGSQTGRSNYLI